MPEPRTLLERLRALWQGSGAPVSHDSAKYTEDDLGSLRDYFDEEFYVGTNPDVDFSGIDPLLHFLEFGRLQVRDPRPDFSIVDYLEMYPDIRNTEINPFVHYVQHGRREGRKTKKDAEFVQDARCSQFDVEKLRGFFDEEYYLARYPGLELDGIEPVVHYIKQGEQRGRQPNCFFDPGYYRQQVNGYAGNLAIHYLERGQKSGLPGFWCDAGDREFDTVCQAIDIEPIAAAAKLKQAYHDRRKRFSDGVLAEMIKKAVKLDPLIANGEQRQFSQFGAPPFWNQASTYFVSAMCRLQKEAGWRRAKIVVLVPCIRPDSTSRVTSLLLEALCTFVNAEDIVVLGTETSGHEHLGRLPGGCRYIDFAALRGNLDPEKQARLLFEYLRSLVPAHVINVNSALFRDVLETYGCQLKDVTSIACYLLRGDEDKSGSRDGDPANKFHVYQEWIDVFITDSQPLKTELVERFSLPEDTRKRLVLLEAPVGQSANPTDAQVRKVREIFEVPHA